jgi:hypothetical protein
VKRVLTLWPWVILFGAAIVLALASGGPSAADSPIASVRNPGPRGAMVLETYLRETGAKVELLDQPLTTLPAGLEVLVIAAPSERPITEAEVKSLEQFIRAGGTLVYLAPRPPSAQPELKKWLGITEAAPTPIHADDTAMGDLGGETIPVDDPGGLLAGTKRLRVSADTEIELSGDEAKPVAGKRLWRKPMDKGEVWVAAGADLLENRRLELLDNAQLWANLSRKRLAFDEGHFSAITTPWSANLWATFGQFVFVGLVYVAVRGRRLGPGRPTLERQHRSILEYVRSMGGLMRRAGVEGPLQQQLKARLRRLMFERLGVSLALPEAEASRLLAGHTGLPDDAWTKLAARLDSEPSGFARAAADAARIEDAIVGRRAA